METKTIAIDESVHSRLHELKTEMFETENATFSDVVGKLITEYDEN